MPVVVEIIGILERTSITKDDLEVSEEISWCKYNLK